MTDRLLICSDLDRTLIPNGPQPESPGARKHFAALACHPQVMLAYVSGRHRALVEQAISCYQLPLPDYVVGDVGTTIYRVGTAHDWRRQMDWEKEIAQDWAGKTRSDLATLLADLPNLRLQEATKQNAFKLSWYLPLASDQEALSALIQERLVAHGVSARLIFSVDETAAVGLLDVLPSRASKYHAVEALMRMTGFDHGNTIFCGDSGNDLEVLASPIPAVLVANAQADVKALAFRLSEESGHPARLYIASGDFHDMNGNYSGGALEGIAHYHPEAIDWMGFPGDEQK